MASQRLLRREIQPSLCTVGNREAGDPHSSPVGFPRCEGRARGASARPLAGRPAVRASRRRPPPGPPIPAGRGSADPPNPPAGKRPIPAARGSACPDAGRRGNSPRAPAACAGSRPAARRFRRILPPARTPRSGGRFAAPPRGRAALPSKGAGPSTGNTALALHGGKP